jgi:ubiquinone/menaquinone biosynthesis C-methylase UbiE
LSGGPGAGILGRVNEPETEAQLVGGEGGYSEQETGRLELIWGDGFLSPGGREEIGRILAGDSIAGCTVLDIGCGVGGVDIALVEEHAAGQVVGVDVQQELVSLAVARVAAAGMADRVGFVRIDPGPLPFDESSFDVVFSKDAIIHVEDKEELYREAFRVLCPGGRLFVSDWLRGEDDALTGQVEEFVIAAEHGFVMARPSEVKAIVERVGFDGAAMDDRRSWYLAEATAELGRLRGDLQVAFVDRWGEDAAAAEIQFWQVLVASLASGALAPHHLRARKPPRPDREVAAG